MNDLRTSQPAVQDEGGMPRCTNDSERYYSGNEPSPLGRGLSARRERDEQVRVGKDGGRWIARRCGATMRWVAMGKARRNPPSVPSGRDGASTGASTGARTRARQSTRATTTPTTTTEATTAATAVTTIEPRYAIISCPYIHIFVGDDGAPNAEFEQLLADNGDVAPVSIGAHRFNVTRGGSAHGGADNTICLSLPSVKPIAALLAFVDTLTAVRLDSAFKFSTMEAMRWIPAKRLVEVDLVDAAY